MKIKVGTFNLNNLFSRFNFKAAANLIENASGDVSGLTLRYEFSDPSTYRLRTFMGKLVQEKTDDNKQKVADRILAMDVDVLAVQEVENLDILRQFNAEQLNGLYPYQILIEGNDNRFIDVGLLSKLPVGAVTSFQTAVHPSDLGNWVFSRDLLEVEIWSPNRTIRLFRIYNNHLKSQYVPWNATNPATVDAANDLKRKNQAEMVSAIVEARTRPDSRFVIIGDMNDSPDAATLAPMTQGPLEVVNALENPKETRPAKPESGGHDPATTAWTHRFKKSGKPPKHELYDQIWLSPALSDTLSGAYIDRRKLHGGDGSDHDPAWVELVL